MKDINTKLSKFRNLNLRKYLNDTLPRVEKSVIMADLNYVEKVRKEIDTEIFKSFLLNSDSLLDVLYTYEAVKNNLGHLEDVKTDLRKFNLNKEETKFVDKTRLEEFRSILKNFTTEVESYDTGNRVLVHFDIFIDEDENRNIFILTNDILIIGKIDNRIRKYQLVNAFSYSIIDLQVHDNNLFVVLSQSITKYKGEKKSVDKFYTIFKDINYSYDDDIDKKEIHKNNGNNDILEYLIDTEQYETIDKVEYKTLISMNPQPFRISDLFHILDLLDDADHLTIVLVQFLLTRFTDIIQNINRLMPLRELIDHIFEMCNSFRQEQTSLIEEIDSSKINNTKILMMMEKQILKCFELIEARIFNKRFHTDDVDEIIKLLKEKLMFDDFDFSYMTDYFTNKKKYHQEECFNDAKREIDTLLNEMICN